jgi:phage I-like protein
MGVSFASCLSDSSAADGLTSIPIALTGSWVKDGHRFSITKEDLDDIVKNFEKRGNGQVVVDYEHASENPAVARGGAIPAAAWIHALSVRPGVDGKETLYASVDWTPKAKEHIKAKEYRYFSPAIDWGATDKSTGRSKGATLTSGALTNHPFLEDLPAIQLSDKGSPTQVENEKLDDTTGDPEHATVSGTKVHRSDFAYVGDPKDKSTWKLPVHDEAHARNALARFGQADIPSSAKAGAARKVVSAAKKHGIDTSGFQEKHMSEKDKKNTMTDVQFGESIVKHLTLVEKAGKKKRLYTVLRDAVTDDSVEYNPAEFGVIARAAIKLLDDIDSYGVVGDRGEQDSLRTEAEKRAKKIDTEDEDAEILGDKVAKAEKDDQEDPLQASEEMGDKGCQRMSIRKMKSADGVGHLGHHAIIAADGKLAGYVTHAHLMAHAKKNMSEAGRSEGTLRATDEELQEALRKHTGRPLTLSEVTTLVETGINSSDLKEKLEATETRNAARKLLLTSAVDDKGKFVPRKARELLADNKVTMRDYVDFENASEDVNAAILEGRFLPNQRISLISLCLSDRDNFEKMVKNQPKADRLNLTGISGSGEELSDNPDKEIEARINELLKADPKLPYARAYQQVLMSDAGLKTRYDAAHRKLM